MADSVVTVLLEYLSSLLQYEANLLAGVEDRVKSLHDELELINIFLENSAEKRNDKIVKEVVRQIREAANEAEDVIDSFILKVAEHRRCSAIGRIVYYPSHTLMLRNVGKKIVGIKERINEIYNNKERYGIPRVEAAVNAFEEEAMHRRRREVEEDDVVGFVHDSTTLVQQLTKRDPKLDVISIIGMGGLGKTTLARKIYNNLLGTSHFKYHIWVYVSQDFRTRELLLKILKELGVEFEGKSDVEIKVELGKEEGKKIEILSDDVFKRKLFRCLKGKRYLVVMDDIWRTEVWDEIRSAFPDDSNGSRILITSRNKEVASHASLTSPYLLPFLNKDESWELFRKKVFRRETCSLELETLGRQIVEGCNGLPLSIVVLAGLLAKKEKSPHIWSRFVGHVTSFLTREEDTTICQKILALSYTDLPRHLKPCFLYFGIYPEDSEIPVRQLMHMWVAEGFIKYSSHRFPEDVAEIYLEELIDRSLIQVAGRRSTDGRVKKCRIHDLLRELCMSESAEEKFLEVHSDYSLSTNKSRRLSVQGNTRRYISLNPSVHPNARSLFFFSDTWHDCLTLAWVQRNFKFLRVLNFEEAISLFPETMATFIHLKYLKIAYQYKGTRVSLDFIDNLTNLETLYVMGSSLEGCLPKGIYKMRRLRNLYLADGLKLPCNLEEVLGNLQVLSVATINYDPEKHSFPVVLDKFPNVRKLKILIQGSLKPEIGEANEIVTFPSVHHLAHLEILRIQNFGMLPGNPIPFPSGITKLTLTGMVRVGDYVTVLGRLPKLQILKLEGDTASGDFHESFYLLSKRKTKQKTKQDSVNVIGDSFPQLKVLKLCALGIEEWIQERGAMPSLRHLVITDCHLFRSAPELLSLTTLKSVEVIHCPSLVFVRMKNISYNVSGSARGRRFKATDQS